MADKDDNVEEEWSFPRKMGGGMIWKVYQGIGKMTHSIFKPWSWRLWNIVSLYLREGVRGNHILKDKQLPSRQEGWEAVQVVEDGGQLWSQDKSFKGIVGSWLMKQQQRPQQQHRTLGGERLGVPPDGFHFLLRDVLWNWWQFHRVKELCCGIVCHFLIDSRTNFLKDKKYLALSTGLLKSHFDLNFHYFKKNYCYTFSTY